MGDGRWPSSVRWDAMDHDLTPVVMFGNSIYLGNVGGLDGFYHRFALQRSGPLGVGGAYLYEPGIAMQIDSNGRTVPPANGFFCARRLPADARFDKAVGALAQPCRFGPDIIRVVLNGLREMRGWREGAVDSARVKAVADSARCKAVMGVYDAATSRVPASTGVYLFSEGDSLLIGYPSPRDRDVIILDKRMKVLARYQARW